MPSEQSPTVWRRRLALELRRLREAAQMTCEDVAGQLECSASKISRIETGRVSVSPRDVRDILTIYAVPPEQCEALLELARESRQKGWWQAWSDSLQPDLAVYVGLESAAAEVRIYQTHRIPGQLQTPDYARAIFTAGDLVSPAPDGGKMATLQAARQRRGAGGQLRVVALLDEAVLRRPVGGTQVMRGQLERLLDLPAAPNYCVQVIPLRAGGQLRMDLPFGILSFPHEADPDVVYLRYPTGALWIEDPAEVARYHEFFGQLQAAALSPEESAALIATVLKELYPGEPEDPPSAAP